MCSLTASQPGNATYAAATSVTQSFTVSSTGTASAVVLASSPNPADYGQSITLTASVTPAAATGRVTFYDGVTVLGEKALVSGIATLATDLLPSGPQQLRAYYSGDLTYAKATSLTVAQTVTALGQSDSNCHQLRNGYGSVLRGEGRFQRRRENRPRRYK